MDARPDPQRVLGLAEGGAHVIHKAGGVATDYVIRSLTSNQRLLGTREIALIHHTDCGMLTFRDHDLKPSIHAGTGTRPPFPLEHSMTSPKTSVRPSPASGRAPSLPIPIPSAGSSATYGPVA